MSKCTEAFNLEEVRLESECNRLSTSVPGLILGTTVPPSTAKVTPVCRVVDLIPSKNSIQEEVKKYQEFNILLFNRNNALRQFCGIWELVCTQDSYNDCSIEFLITVAHLIHSNNNIMAITMF